MSEMGQETAKPARRLSALPPSFTAEVLRRHQEGEPLRAIAASFTKELGATVAPDVVSRLVETERLKAEKERQRPAHEYLTDEVERLNVDLCSENNLLRELQAQLSEETLTPEVRKRLEAEYARRLSFSRLLLSQINALHRQARRPKKKPEEEAKPVDPRAAEKELTERPIKLEEGGPEMPKVMVLHSGAEGPAIDWFTEFTTRNITFEPCKHPEPFPEWAENIDEDDALALFVDLSNSRAPLDWLKVLLDFHPDLEPRLVFAVGPETPPALREEMELFRHPDHPIIEFPLERDKLDAVTKAVVQATRDQPPERDA